MPLAGAVSGVVRRWCAAQTPRPAVIGVLGLRHATGHPRDSLLGVRSVAGDWRIPYGPPRLRGDWFPPWPGCRRSSQGSGYSGCPLAPGRYAGPCGHAAPLGRQMGYQRCLPLRRLRQPYAPLRTRLTTGPTISPMCQPTLPFWRLHPPRVLDRWTTRHPVARHLPLAHTGQCGPTTPLPRGGRRACLGRRRFNRRPVCPLWYGMLRRCARFSGTE